MPVPVLQTLQDKADNTVWAIIRMQSLDCKGTRLYDAFTKTKSNQLSWNALGGIKNRDDERRYMRSHTKEKG